MTLCNVRFTFVPFRPPAGPSVVLAAVLLLLLACGDGATEPPPDPNRAPQPAGAIPPLVVAYSDSATVDLAGYFRDPDGDPLTFAATSSDPGVAGATVAGSVVTVRGMSRGVATLTVTATDPGGLSARQAFEASVPNRGPEPVGTIAGRQLKVGDTITIGVAAHFADPESDALSFSAASSDANVASAEIEGDSLRLVAVAKGTATVTVTAADPGGETADQSFGVTVPNRAPFVSDTIPGDSVLLGDTIELRLAAYFADPDGDSLGFAAESSAPEVVTAGIVGGELIVVPVAPGHATVTVAASDPEGLAAAQSFPVVAAHPNRPPVAVGEILDRVIHVGTTDSLDVSPFFSDPDGASLAYTVRTSRRIRVGVAVDGSVVALAALSIGSSTITVTARDPHGLPATQRFRAVVEPVPAPDLVVDTAMADADSVEVGGAFAFTAVVRNLGNAEAQTLNTLRVYESFDSRITTGDREVGTDSVGPLGAGEASEATVRVTGPPFVGTRFYGACVDAPASETETRNNCSAAVPIRFWQPNRAPQPRDSMRAQTLEPGEAFRTSVTRFFTDADRDSLRYTAASSDEAVATASVSGDVLTVEARDPGTATITVTARDITNRPPGSFTATQEFEVTVRLGLRPDLVVEMAQDSFVVGPQQSFILGAVVRNEGTLDVPSGTTVRFFLSADATIDSADSLVGTATAGPVPQSGRQAVSVNLTGHAEAGVYYYGACVDAVAEESRTENNCSGALIVVVDEERLPNRAPTVTRTFADITDASPGVRFSGALDQVFSDPDRDPLTYAAKSSDEAVARPETVGDTLFVHALAVGTATITVTATDPAGLSASTSFEIAVLAPCVGFCIQTGFTNAVSQVQRAAIGGGVAGWEAILANTELPDVTVPEGFSCAGLSIAEATVVDDHLFLAHVATIDGPGGTLARAGFCAQRLGNGFPAVSLAVFDADDIDQLVSRGMLEDVAFHEVAHGLGFIHGRMNSLGLLNTVEDPHFTGSGALAAFDAAGGASYAGAKVPMSADLSHWRESVFDVEIMTPSIEAGVPQPVSAITLGAMSDMGYSVNFRLASDYTLPDSRPPVADAGRPRPVFDFSGDVDQGPVTVLGPDGRVVDVIPPPAPYDAPTRPYIQVTIDRRSAGAGGRQAALQVDREVEDREEPEGQHLQPEQVPGPGQEDERRRGDRGFAQVQVVAVQSQVDDGYAGGQGVEAEEGSDQRPEVRAHSEAPGREEHRGDDAAVGDEVLDEVVVGPPFGEFRRDDGIGGPRQPPEVDEFVREAPSPEEQQDGQDDPDAAEVERQVLPHEGRRSYGNPAVGPVDDLVEREHGGEAHADPPRDRLRSGPPHGYAQGDRHGHREDHHHDVGRAEEIEGYRGGIHRCQPIARGSGLPFRACHAGEAVAGRSRGAWWAWWASTLLPGRHRFFPDRENSRSGGWIL